MDRELPLIDPPPWMPATLATIAGFVDACTFVGLFGLFVAQLTGSYVVAGASMFTPGWPEATVLLAVPMFFAGGVAATLVATIAGANGLPALAWALGLETALLAGFAAIMVSIARYRHDRPRPSPPRCSALPRWARRAHWCASAARGRLDQCDDDEHHPDRLEATQAAMTSRDAARSRDRAPACGGLPWPWEAAAAARLFLRRRLGRARLRRGRPLGGGAARARDGRAHATGVAGGAPRVGLDVRTFGVRPKGLSARHRRAWPDDPDSP